jgi:hypothetical protein
MTAANTKRALSDVPEAGVIIQLLNEVKRTPHLPSPGVAGEGPGVRAAFPSPPAPLPQRREVSEKTTPAPANVPTQSGIVPVGAISVADFFALVNWKNRPEDAKPLPAVAAERPPGHEWTVGAVMSAFFGD